MQSTATIFVSIASYRDSELIPTLKDMIANAKHPAALHISICWQQDEDISLFTSAGINITEQTTVDSYVLYRCKWGEATLNIISVHYFQSKGACWARSIAEKLYDNEDWFLQIDSHCRFAEHWDSEAITMIEKLYELSERPVLSAYPPGYDPEDESNRSQYIGRLTFGYFSDERILTIGSVATATQDKIPARCGYLAGGFIFAAGQFVIDVPNDPQIFFIGEEIAMAARAFTHGYDFYTPGKILLWHYYQRTDQKKVWSDHTDEAKHAGDVDLTWYERDRISRQRIRSVLGIEEPLCDLGRYGHGSQRTLKEFERMLGVHFSTQKVQPEVIGSNKVSYYPATIECSEEAWLAKLIYPLQKKVQYNKNEIDPYQEDLKWWYFGVYDAKNNLLIKKTLSPAELMKCFAETDEKNTFEIEFNSSQSQAQPDIIRACPFYHSSGWGESVEKKW